VKQYDLILADPPWSYNDKSLHRGGAERHYRTMSLEGIQGLPVGEMAKENAVLCLWATCPLLPEAIETMKSWGFKYKTVLFVWGKTSKNGGLAWGMGHHTRSNAEIMLLGVRGKGVKRVNAGVLNLQLVEREKHSAKPYRFHQLIEKLYGDVERVELFARVKRDGWDVAISDEVTCEGC
jgi:N6-adenosine-specific RNA methylase IME4